MPTLIAEGAGGDPSRWLRHTSCRAGIAIACGAPEAAEASLETRRRRPGGEEQRRAVHPERLLDRETADVRDLRHWKISVVQSPPWRRTSWARAGPVGRL
ncbi:MAG: hypothetical protein ABWZ63_08000, partial [Thermoleophilaceae bacterium]